MKVDTNAWGDPDDPTVVLLHGAGGTRWLWTPHAELLAEAYRVVAPDLPAHGTHPDASFRFERAVADVGAVLDEEGPAVLVGHSLGAQVAMGAAVAHEPRVDGLFVAGTASEPSRLMNWLGLPLAYLIEGAAHVGLLRDWLDDMYGLEDDRQLPPDTVDARDAAVATARGIRGSLYHDAAAAAEAYDGPTVVAHGREEDDEAAAEAFAARLDAGLCWYDGGHGYPSRQPAGFVELVEPFLADIADQLCASGNASSFHSPDSGSSGVSSGSGE